MVVAKMCAYISPAGGRETDPSCWLPVCRMGLTVELKIKKAA